MAKHGQGVGRLHDDTTKDEIVSKIHANRVKKGEILGHLGSNCNKK